MSFYPENIDSGFHDPKFAGKMADANAVGTSAAFVCGSVLRLKLRIDPETKEILAAKFQTNGCGFMIAAADRLIELVSGKKLTDLHGLETDVLKSKIGSDQAASFGDRRHCFETVISALRSALADFRALQIEEFTGEKPLICTCFGVSEETIENVIAENAAASVEEVGEICRAGTGCGSCQPLILELLDFRDF